MGTGIMLKKDDQNTILKVAFPSQELPCSGSTGLISANLLKKEKHPEEF